MASYKLSYFDFNGGRGEPIRILFHAAGIEFKDDRLSFEQFGKMRKSTPFDSLPVLQIDKVTVTQSNAIMRYLGKLADLYPKDDRQALYCDEVMDAIENLSFHIGQTMRLEGDALRAAREKLAEGWMTTFLRGLDGLLSRGGGEYFADNRFTVADLKAYFVIRWIQSGALDHIPKDIVPKTAPALAKFQKRIEGDPVVVAYYASRA